MRFLCLHGRGTSANIFKSQTEAFRKLVAGNHSFDFIDGPFLDGPAAGIDLFYAPPYYKLYEQMTLDSIKDGHQWLADYIDENGPYDAVMGFSQGCSLASSFLLAHKSENPFAPPPFKAAIFICGGIPLDVLSSHGVEVTQEAYDWDQSSKIALMSQASSEAILREGKNRWGAKFASANYLDKGYLYGGLNGAKSSMVFGIDVAKIPKRLKISIPTVHVFGSRDPRFPASVTLAQFCDERIRRTFDHRFGHEIPRTTICSTTLAESVQWCTKMAGL